jgi:hypothetical protein
LLTVYDVTAAAILVPREITAQRAAAAAELVVRRRRSIMASVDPDYDLVIETYSAIWPRYEKLGFEKLTEQEQTIFCTWQFVCEVNNGRIHQFFFNPSGEFNNRTTAPANQPLHLIAAALRFSRFNASPAAKAGERCRYGTSHVLRTARNVS